MFALGKSCCLSCGLSLRQLPGWREEAAAVVCCLPHPGPCQGSLCCTDTGLGLLLKTRGRMMLPESRSAGSVSSAKLSRQTIWKNQGKSYLWPCQSPEVQKRIMKVKVGEKKHITWSQKFSFPGKSPSHHEVCTSDTTSRILLALKWLRRLWEFCHQAVPSVPHQGAGTRDVSTRAVPDCLAGRSAGLREHHPANREEAGTFLGQ